MAVGQTLVMCIDQSGRNKSNDLIRIVAMNMCVMNTHMPTATALQHQQCYLKSHYWV